MMEGLLVYVWGNNIIVFDLIGLKDLKWYVILYILLIDWGIL